MGTYVLHEHTFPCQIGNYPGAIDGPETPKRLPLFPPWQMVLAWFAVYAVLAILWHNWMRPLIVFPAFELFWLFLIWTIWKERRRRDSR